MKEDVFTIITRVTQLSTLLPLLLFLLKRKQLNRSLLLFGYYILLSVFGEVYSFLTQKYAPSYNSLGLHFYTFFEYVLISFFFASIVGKNAARVIKICVLLFAVLCIVYSGFIVGLHSYNTFTRTLESVLLTIMCLYYFYYIMEQEADFELLQYPYFWINTGFLLYFMGNIFMFMMSKMMYDLMPHEDMYLFYCVHHVLNMLANLLFAKGLLCTPPQAKYN